MCAFRRGPVAAEPNSDASERGWSTSGLACGDGRDSVIEMRVVMLSRIEASSALGAAIWGEVGSDELRTAAMLGCAEGPAVSVRGTTGELGALGWGVLTAEVAMSNEGGGDEYAGAGGENAGAAGLNGCSGDISGGGPSGSWASNVDAGTSLVGGVGSGRASKATPLTGRERTPLIGREPDPDAPFSPFGPRLTAPR